MGKLFRSMVVAALAASSLMMTPSAEADGSTACVIRGSGSYWDEGVPIDNPEWNGAGTIDCPSAAGTWQVDIEFGEDGMAGTRDSCKLFELARMIVTLSWTTGDLPGGFNFGHAVAGTSQAVTLRSTDGTINWALQPVDLCASGLVNGVGTVADSGYGPVDLTVTAKAGPVRARASTDGEYGASVAAPDGVALNGYYAGETYKDDCYRNDYPACTESEDNFNGTLAISGRYGGHREAAVFGCSFNAVYPSSSGSGPEAPFECVRPGVLFPPFEGDPVSDALDSLDGLPASFAGPGRLTTLQLSDSNGPYDVATRFEAQVLGATLVCTHLLVETTRDFGPWECTIND